MAKTENEINAEKAAKPRPDLLPARALLAGGRAFGYGAAKHGLGRSGRGTYRDAGTEQATVETHRASFMRHWCAYWAGETIDPESGLSHLDCMMAQLSIIIDLVEDPPCDGAATPEAAWAVTADGCRGYGDTREAALDDLRAARIHHKVGREDELFTYTIERMPGNGKGCP